MIGLGLSLWTNTAAYSGAAAPADLTWDPATSSANYTFSGGNLIASRTTGSGDALVRCATARSSGYFEVVITTQDNNLNVGVAAPGSLGTADWVGLNGDTVGYAANGNIFCNGASVATGATFTTGDIIGVCLKAGKLYFSKNTVWQAGGDPSAGTGGITPTSAIATGLPSANTSGNSVMTGRFSSGHTGTIPTGVTAWT
jgi:hypothetical protein